MEEYDEDRRDDYAGAAYILLDMAIGEFHVATGIRNLDFQETPDAPILEGLKPFIELPEIFDAYLKSRS